jgi:hypothetical protein
MWVASKAGVWRASADSDPLPASAADVTMIVPPMRARPRASTKRTKDDYGGFYTERVTSPRTGTWCTTSDTTTSGAGDGAIESVCFTAGTAACRASWSTR